MDKGTPHQNQGPCRLRDSDPAYLLVWNHPFDAAPRRQVQAVLATRELVCLIGPGYVKFIDFSVRDTKTATSKPVSPCWRFWVGAKVGRHINREARRFYVPGRDGRFLDTDTPQTRSQSHAP